MVTNLFSRMAFNIIFMVVYITLFIGILMLIGSGDTPTSTRLISFANYKLSLAG